MLKKFCVFSLSFLVLLLNSCSDKNKFEVRCQIYGSENKMVYLEEFGLNGAVVIDSVKSNKRGDFVFRHYAYCSPEFFRLRIDSFSYLFAVDSTEKIKIKGSLDNLQEAMLTGSDDAIKLRFLVEAVSHSEDTIRTLVSNYKNEGGDRDSLNSAVLAVVENYKQKAKSVVLGFHFMSSYYALYKKMIYGMEPFSAEHGEDRRYFYMITQNWKRYPDSQRFKHLSAMVKEIKNKKTVGVEDILDGREHSSLLNLSLPDSEGKFKSLSELAGKVVFLYFHNASIMSNYDILALKDLKKKHSDRLEIYHVSFEEDVEQWRSRVSSLPWVCVNDVSCKSALTYNIMQLPASYLLAKDGSVIGRDVTIGDVNVYMGW